MLKLFNNKKDNIDKDKYDKVFYLKINIKEAYTYTSFEHWLKIAQLLNAKVFVICDKDDIKNFLIKRFSKTYPNLNFIKSSKSRFIKKIVKYATNDNWRNAGLAHLTTYEHAYKNNIQNFWNIDADDTFMVARPEICAEILNQAEKYAVKNNINAFSLDMTHTRSHGKLWSYGITFTNNINKWIKLFNTKSIYSSLWQNIFPYSIAPNIDCFTQYVTKENPEYNLKIGTFHVKNLYFIHWKFHIAQTVSIFKDKTLEYPLMRFGSNELSTVGVLPIPESSVKLNFDIDANELQNVKNDILNIDFLKRFDQKFQ